MVDVTAGQFVLNMNDWNYVSLAPRYLRGFSSGGSVEFESNNDVNALVSGPTPNMAVLRMRLEGTGWGDFDAFGVPHAGVVQTAFLRGLGTTNVTFDRVNMPITQFIDVISSSDPFRIKNTILEGDDNIRGYSGNVWWSLQGDVLFGGNGDDTIHGLGGNDTLSGGEGDDLINSVAAASNYASNARIDGGPGIDIWAFDTAKSGVIVDLEAGTSNGDLAVNMEGVLGSAFSDRIVGSSAANRLDGGQGDDTITGAKGDDTISGGAGNDHIDAGPGANELSGDDGDDLLRGADGYDRIAGGAGDDTINAGDSFDDINGNMGDDVVAGEGGDDWVSGGKDNDRVDGGGGDDQVFGNMGDDSCYGGSGADTVRGGQAQDVIFGDAGDDWLSGDRGSDTLTGGTGADTFNSFVGSGIDRITDFSVADGDRVRLEGVSAFQIVAAGGNTEIRFGQDDVVTLVGVSPASLGADSIFTTL